MSVTDHPLHALPKFGDGVGIHRVRFLMDACGLDADDISRRALVVTGSNGKGSTARIAAELMQEAGEAVGLFTSPHLYRYNERFRIDGVPVDDDALVRAMDEVLRAVDVYRANHDDAIGAFEAQFVVALVLFRRCRWLVLEAGIGGRYDPVRLARAPVGALVSLDLEHAALLGHSLLEIALDKLDAVAAQGTMILGETCRPLSEQISAYAALTGVTTEFADPHAWRDLGVRDTWQHFSIRDGTRLFPELQSRLVGGHQINNHAVAIALCRKRLEFSGLWPMPDLETRWRDAIARVTWPGRLEAISQSPLVIVDVGHTPEGVKAALAGFRALTGERPAILVTGGSKNKAVEEMLAILAPSFARILCTAAHHNGLAASAVEALVKTLAPDAETILCPTIADAVATIRQIAARPDASVFVAGGLFLAAEFADAWRGGDPRVLRFF